MGWPVTCTECGTAIATGGTDTPLEQRTPCHNCGSLARTVHITASDSAVATDSVSATVALVRTASERDVAMPMRAVKSRMIGKAGVGSERETEEALTFLGLEVGHSCAVRFAPLTDEPDGAQQVEVVSEEGRVLASGVGATTVDALLGVILHLLPPTHPEHPTDEPPREP